MKSYTPTVASSNTSAAVRGAAATPIVASPFSGSSVKTGASHAPKTAPAVKSSNGFPAPTHSYGAGTINKIHGKNK